MSKNVRNYIISNAYAAVSIYPLSYEATRSLPLFNYLTFYQPDGYLRALGWSSGSTLVNNYVLMLILIVLVFFHFLNFVFYCKTKSKQNGSCSICTKIYRFLTFAVYIRIFILLYLYIIIMIFSEIKYYIKYDGDGEKENGNIASLSFSCIFFIWIIFILILICIWW